MSLEEKGGRAAAGPLLPGSLLPRLHRLRLALPHRVSRHPGGDHLSRSKGRSMEFAEHRDYSPGDDLRHLDWNVMARHEKLVVKQYQAELEQTVTILIDQSLSMGEPKALLARQLAAALAVVGLAGNDRVGAGVLGQDSLYHPPLRGSAMAHRLLRFLEPLQTAGRCDLDASLERFSRRQGKPGQIVVISDFLEPGGGLAGLSRLLYARNRITLIQLLAPEELDPEWRGDFRLKDVETLEFNEITMSSRVLQQYKAALQAHNDALYDWSTRYGCRYHMLSSDTSVERAITHELRQAGVVR